MAAEETPRGLRSIIAIVGCRNAGKSSLINAMTNQEIAIVSEIAGTTTDAVPKPYELLPLGPVTFYDTAGLDDEGELGLKRVAATKKILLRSDVAVIVCGSAGVENKEKEIIGYVQNLNIPFLLVFNKIDENPVWQTSIDYCEQNGIKWIGVSAKNKINITELKEAIIDIVPDELKNDPVLAGDLFKAGDTVVLVTPIDLAAPKGRLILPQVQVLREILDGDAIAVVVKEKELESALDNLKHKPALVITDSQVILKVSGDVNPDIKLTTFSTLFARFKGNLEVLVEGARSIDSLKDGDKVLIAEACSHHLQADDIGKVKIPRWLSQYTGKELKFEFSAGYDFPENLEEYALVIHCGACMLNRVEMVRRLNECVRRGVPITNYGVCISKTQGVLERVVAPFEI